MRAGFNATRRNRNIGTARHGHGQNNRLCVASPKAVTGIFWSQLGEYEMVRKNCGARELPIFVEAARDDCSHACSASDVAAGLSLLPADDYVTLAAVVLRQPKREEEILHPCWGRMVGYANIGRPQDGTAAGPVVMLEAMKPDRVWWLDKSMGPAAAAEAERLRKTGTNSSGNRAESGWSRR